MTSQEIIDFMLGQSPSSSHRVKEQASTPPAVNPAASTSSRQEAKKQQQRNAVIKALIQTMGDWLDTDSSAQQVLHTIANLRDRIWYTSQYQGTLSVQESSPHWQSFGYRSGRGCWARPVHDRNAAPALATTADDSLLLNVHDLELALDHGLVQHERLLGQLRRLVSGLGATLEALGRRLDELYPYELLQEPSGGNVYQQRRGGGGGPLAELETWNNVYAATAQELYRKQMLAEQVWDSAIHSGLLLEHHGVNTIPNDDDDDGATSNPRRVAHHCSAVWSRLHSESYLCRRSKLMDEIQNQAAR
jgi:hypothetical protein